VGAIRTVVDQVTDAILSIGGSPLALSPAAVLPQNTPNTRAENVFSVTLQTANTDKFRDRSGGTMRIGHDLTVSILSRIKPNDQQDAYLDAIDLEEKVIIAVIRQSALPRERTLYESTRRTLAPSGEYVMIEINFDIEQSIKVG